MNENDEMLDLVDANDIKIGVTCRGDMVASGYDATKGYVRFAEAFILNEKGEVWVPIRGLHKSIAPGGCDFSVAEHVLSGESYKQAIERAFFEEAGMTVDSSSLTFLGKLPPTKEKPVYEALFLYVIRNKQYPVYSTDEFSSASWMSLKEFEKLLVSGPPTKTALLPAFRLLQSKLG